MTNQDGIDFYRIFSVFRRWWWVIVGCALIPAVMVFINTSLRDPSYEATTMMLVSPGQAAQSSDYTTLMTAEKLALTYKEMLKGDTILEAVISQLGLQISSGELTDMIQVGTVPNTQLIRLTVESNSPEQVALLTNTIAETFITQIQKLQTERFISSLTSQKEAMDAEMVTSQETQDEINSLNASKIALDARLDRLERQASELRSNFQSLEREYQEFQFNAAQLTDIVKVIEPAKAPANDSVQPYQATTTLMVGSTQDAGSAESLTGFTNEQLTQTFRELLTGRSVLESVIERVGLEETYQSLVSQIQVAPVLGTKLIRLNVYDNDTGRAVLIADTIVEVFLENIRTLLEGPYTARLANMQKQIDALSAQIEGTQAEIDELISNKVQVEMELARQQNLLSEQRTNYQTLQQYYQQSLLALTNNSESVVIVEPARVPETAVGSNRILYTVLAAITGALVGMAIAFLYEYINGTLQTEEEISQLLGLNVLGTVGRLSNKEKGLVVDSQPRSPNAEAFRIMATNIRYTNLVNPRRILLVTSPFSQEGKSLITANLATALALTEMRVIVVDADLRKPQQHRIFRINQGGGLTSALVEGTMDGRVRQVESSGLKILTSGHLPPNPAEMLGSARMVSLLEELREQADIVLIDCPPVLPVADAMILAPHVDGVLLVLRANHTRGQSANEAVVKLRNVGANFAGVVLNAMPRSRKYYYYSHNDENKTKRKGGSNKILVGFSSLRNRFVRKGSSPEKM